MSFLGSPVHDICRAAYFLVFVKPFHDFKVPILGGKVHSTLLVELHFVRQPFDDVQVPVLGGQVQSVASYVCEIILLIQSSDKTKMTIPDRSAEPSSIFRVRVFDLRYHIVAPEYETGERIGLGENEVPYVVR